MSDTPNTTPPTTPRKRSFFASDRNKLIAVIGSTTLLIGASFGVQAIAESKPFQHAKMLVAEGSPFTLKAAWGHSDHHRGWRGGRSRFANMSDAEVEKLINRVVRHASIEIEATKEQEEKITALLVAVAKEMRPVRQEFRAAGKQMAEILMSETVDREKLEALRAGRIAEMDKISKELVKAAADVAEVLDAKQRKIVNDRIEMLRSMRNRWRRG